jgi:hypothetical protein
VTVPEPVPVFAIVRRMSSALALELPLTENVTVRFE